MSSVEKQLNGTIATLLSTEFNSLAANGWTALGSIFDNTVGGGGGDGYPNAIMELACTLAGNASAGAGLLIFLAKSPDGSNYEDLSSATVTLNRRPDLFLSYTGGQTTTRVSLPLWLPGVKFKPYAKNTDGTNAMSASGNTLKILPFTREMV